MSDETNTLVKNALDKAFRYFCSNDYENAEELYRQILRVQPNNLDALQMCGLTCAKNGNYSDGEQFIKKSIELAPDNFKTYNNLALVQSCGGNCLGAIETLCQAISIAPHQAYLYTNLAIEYKKAGLLEKAKETFEKASTENPHCEHVLFNHAAFVHEYGDLGTAQELYLKALEVKDDFPVCHYNLSSCYFLQGNYADGWKEYEWRWQYFPQFAKVRDRFSQPYWDGSQCERLFLYTEQGIGDTFMFLRYLPLVRKLAKHITLECVPELKSLLREHVDKIYTSGPIPDFDVHCSLLSLPLLLGGEIPAPLSYRSTNIPNEESWGSYPQMRVGIVWGGSPIHPNDSNRSCYLKHFHKLQMPGVKLFSLQKHHFSRLDGINLLEGGKDMNLVDLKEFITTWDDTAGIIEQLDLIICVDTAIAHLAASMGKPVWMLLPFVPDWRWGMKGMDTQWYPSMVLFRQPSIGDWESVFNKVSKLLSNVLEMTIASKE